MQKTLQIRKLGMAHGLRWIRQGFELFAQSPQTWLWLSLMNVALFWLLEHLGALGGLLSMLLTPVIVAGWLLGCHALRSGRTLTVAYFWAGFFHQTNRLLLLGVFLVGMLLLLSILMVALGGETLSAVAEQWQPGDSPEQLQAILGDNGMSLMLQLFAVLAIPMLVIAMAMQFAPMLVVFEALSPWSALRISFMAFWINLPPLFVFSLVWSFTYLTVLQLGGDLLGTLLVILLSPSVIASAYAAYREIVPETVPAVEVEN